MPVPMVNVWEMAVAVAHRGVGMGMAVGFSPVPEKIMRMLVMLVVRVFMGVRHGIVRVLVPMALGEM